MKRRSDESIEAYKVRVKEREDRKTEQLGMSYGKAHHILKKMMLFTLMKRCSMDSCFVCKKPIETHKDMTIEHKVPWESRDGKLFWDLDNIAFSHKWCNKVHPSYTRTYAGKQKVYPYKGGLTKGRLIKERREGLHQCSKCGEWKTFENFSPDKRKTDGLVSQCRPCQKIYNNLRYHSRQIRLQESSLPTEEKGGI